MVAGYISYHWEKQPLDVPAPSHWHPIETAPEEVAILVWYSGKPCTAFYQDGHWMLVLPRFKLGGDTPTAWIELP